MSLILEPDVTETCRIKGAAKDTIYVRTGVHGDGSCFYHAFLRATRISYRLASYEDRLRQVTKLRKLLAEEFDESHLKSLGQGETRRMLFFSELRGSMDAGFPDDDEWGHDLNTRVKLGPIFEKCMNSRENFYFDLISAIKKEVDETRPEVTKRARLHEYIHKWCYKTFLETHARVLESFKQRLMHDQVGAVDVEYISRYFQYNFVFLREGESGEYEYYPFYEKWEPKSPFIVLLWKDECHYEIIGQLNFNKTVKRVFQAEDSLIQHLTQSL